MNPNADQSKQLIDWLLLAAQRGASDLHIVSGSRPTIRNQGNLEAIGDERLTGETVKTLLSAICPDERLEEFSRSKNIDFAPVIDLRTGQISLQMARSSEQKDSDQLQRFRANFFVAGNQMGACFRVIPRSIPELAWAGFPKDLADRITNFRNGMVLFTGVTGSGKSTSLAMIVQKLIKLGGRRVVTIEDPIEYLFQEGETSLVTQREVGQDVQSFADGLKFGLRQDPDIILVGEIRDRETAQIALSAAETGHLILSTLHSRDAKGAINRFTDLFPGMHQQEVRSQLALSLRTIVSQHLLPSNVEGSKRELALEVMFNSTAITAAIRMGKIESIDNNIQTSKSDGMYLLDDSISRLLAEHRIDRETAERFVSDPWCLNR